MIFFIIIELLALVEKRPDSNEPGLLLSSLLRNEALLRKCKYV